MTTLRADRRMSHAGERRRRGDPLRACPRALAVLESGAAFAMELNEQTKSAATQVPPQP